MTSLGFGEAMLRFSPLTESDGRGNPSAAAPYLRAVGGDELNVQVCLSRLGRPGCLASVLPPGPLGDVVANSGGDAGVDVTSMMLREGADVGTFTVQPELRTVFYQRSQSAFAQQREGAFEWDAYLAGHETTFLHCTGITPMCSAAAAVNWTAHIEAAAKAGVPIICDLNHRPQLGTLEKLWALTEPHVHNFEMLVLSLASLRGLAALLGVAVPEELQTGAAEDTPAWEELLAALYTTILERTAAGAAEGASALRLACCFKIRTGASQRRWSIVVDAAGAHSTAVAAVLHEPKDECGGGSAWCAGVMDYFMENGLHGGCGEAASRGDNLAALCQETAGDHSIVTRAELEATK